MELVADFVRSDPVWSFSVFTCESGKRTWNQACDSSSYGLRRLSQDERLVHVRAEAMKHVTAQEVEVAMLELWEKLRPNPQTSIDCLCRC